MMGTIWAVLLVALAGSHLGHSSPLRSTPQTYPHDGHRPLEGWGLESGWYAAVPALAFVVTAVGLLIGCTWCYRNKDCKLFTASVTHLHDGRRSQPPDSGFSEPVNNNISEDNNNGPISLREMQNIANNNAAAYIVTENEERNRVSRESVVEFEPLPTGIRVVDPLEHCADWFSDDDFPRNRLQYLREIGRGWFGRVVEGEIEEAGASSSVAVKILNQNASLEDKARFLDEAKMLRDVRHENVLAFVAKCLQEEPWILLFELCPMDLQQYLVMNRPKMAILNESGVPLRLMCDVTAALDHLHSRGYLYGNIWCGAVLVRGSDENVRAVLGRYTASEPPYDFSAPETRTHPPVYTASSDLWSLGTLVWEVCAWGASPTRHPPPLPELPCPYRNHLYQVMQLCWQPDSAARGSSHDILALLQHLRGQHSPDFEQRWQRLKPNTIPTRDEHRAIVHAPTNMPELSNVHAQESLSLHMDSAVSRSSSIMSDTDPLSLQIKSESLTNLHGSLDDVRNIYLTHNETAVLDCHQGNISLDAREKEQDRSDTSMDPWLKDIIAGSQDDVRYYKDVSDVIKNLDNMLNSEKTSSSESSHQASPSRDNLSLDCKKEYPVQSSMVKSPGITNFQNILDMGFSTTEEDQTCENDEMDRDTIGTLSHSFERHSEVDTISQHTLENLTPETPVKDMDNAAYEDIEVEVDQPKDNIVDNIQDTVLPNEIVNSVSEIAKLKELCVASIPSTSDELNIRKDCQTSCDSNILCTDIKDETKSIDDVVKSNNAPQQVENKESIVDLSTEIVENVVLPKSLEQITANMQEFHQNFSDIEDRSIEGESITNDVSVTEVLVSDLIKEIPEDNSSERNILEKNFNDLESIQTSKSDHKNINENSNIKFEETETTIVFENEKSKPLPPEIVQNNFKNLNDTEKEIPSAIAIEDNNFSNECVVSGIDKDSDRNKIRYDRSLSEEHSSLDESKTVSVVCEYTKWINSASDPHSSQYISDFIQSERRHTVLNKDDVPNTCDFKRENDNFQELTTEKHPSSITDTELANDIPESSKTYPADPTLTASLPSMSEIITEDVNTVHSVVKSVSSPEFKLFPITHDISNAVDVATINTVEHIIQQKKDSESIENNEDLLLENEPIVTENSNVLFTVSPRSVITNENGFAGQNKNICIEIENDNFKTDIQVTDYATEAVCNEVDLTPHSQSTTTKTELNDPSNVDLEHSIDNVHTEAEKIYTELDFPTKVSEIPVNEMCISKQITSDQESFKVSTPTEDVFKIPSDNSTVYMNLINDTNIDIPNSSTGNNVHDVIHACLETSDGQNEYSLMKNESTEYLDLPSFGIHEVDKFLHIERVFSSCNEDVVSSTPIASDTSTLANNTTEKSVQENYENIPNYGPGVTLTKLEQKCVPDSLSPFESPSKSHPTDTYDENSSVVLGPFENCSLELFKAVKSSELVDFPKEELLAFSSNFSEMNLETPSPLRDGNFLNEVPELTQDDIQFDNIESISDKPPSDPTETDSGNSATEKRISPSTPPNSPGVFLASTSQKKYLVDIDLTTPPTLPEPDVSLQNEIELNQIELQITSKLAMAENENNMNIEYSGPLTVEGLVSDDEVMLLRDSDSLPESYLAGNGGAMDDLRENLILDEDCVKALRNELELKLPLAQVAAIEPSCDSEWSTELPPPPELVVNYPGALSPIAEETGQQLSAYENDAQWNVSIRTDSSESYPEPCNNSTDEVTELPTGAQSGPQENSTCIIDSGGQSRDHSLNHTYTLHKEQIDIASSRELTMSADSLNASQFKKAMPDVNSPIDDKTYTKEEEKESLERISQISPFLVSPTTDSSAPDNSDNFDNATGVSTLSKTTLPTDAKISKPAETQCLSKATSIDSWCSNDTLYNVEENFDDLALDPDVPDFQSEKEEGNSESTDTLNHNEDEKEASHCSTYIIHDSKSEACESFSPDSITANDNYTYTKAKTDNAGTTPSVVTAELNDSTKNTQTKDLAYGTLMSGLPSYSNCTTELASDCNDWKLQQPEWTRKSPLPDNPSITPPNMKSHEKVTDVSSPRLETEPTLNKMESVDISCLQNNVIDFENKMDVSETQGLLVQMDSPNQGYKNMTPSVTSTPLVDLIEDPEVEVIPMALPGVSENTNDSVNVLNFQAFLQSAEVRPQDLSSNASNELNHDTGVLLEGDSKTLSRNSNKNSLAIAERTPTYSDFENSAVSKPQDINARENSQSCESGISSEDFQKFRSSVSSRPQDLSSLIDASSLLLKSERVSSEIAMGSTPSYCYLEQTSQEKSEESRMSPPNLTNLKESHSLVNFREPNFLLNFDADDEMEQPHSIIITESTMEAFKESSSRPNKPNQNDLERNQSCDLHSYKAQNNDNFEILEKQTKEDISLPKIDNVTETAVSPEINSVAHSSVITNFKEKPYASLPNHNIQDPDKINNDSEKFATVNFLSETFEELIESNVDDGETKEHESEDNVENLKPESTIEPIDSPKQCKSIMDEIQEADGVINGQGNADSKLTTVTQDFLHNEKKFCQLGTYLPMLSDIRFTGPASEIMSTSFTQESPSDPTSGECGRVAADIIKEWDSDTDSHTSNSSSGEFIWKQRTTEQQDNSNTQRGGSQERGEGSGASDASGDSGSGSEGDEVEFVPSSWDCRAAPAKSSLRSLEQATPDNKKRVVFKRQKYHCVYEYPREACDVEAHSPAAYLPDFSTYSEWDPSSAEEAELGYGQLFGAPSPLDLYPLRAGIAFGADYDQDFFISSSARPFESLGIMTSQFFPGKHLKPSLLEQDLSDEVAEEFPPPPSPLSTTTLMQTRSPSLDFTTPDSGVEDITPGSTIDEDFKKKLPEPELTWRPVDSGSSSESVSPSSPGGEALGGLRHTRDKLKLDLPPSPHIPSPRHNRVFSFVLDKPKRREERTEIGTTPLVMTDDTPIVTTSLPLQKECEELPVPEPTFSTFGKSTPKSEPEQKLILTDDLDENTVEVKDESPSPKVVEPVKGEGTVLDSGDEDSGIESSSKATLERKTNVS